MYRRCFVPRKGSGNNNILDIIESKVIFPTKRYCFRPVSYAKYPILIQGETSTGKTSLIKYLAAATGNKVIRINNHEHTDLQEYVGYYASDSQGKCSNANVTYHITKKPTPLAELRLLYKFLLCHMLIKDIGKHYFQGD